jgi:hypothetical protein
VKLRFLLAIVLLAVCNTVAMGDPSSKSDSLNQEQTSAGDFASENEKGLGLFLLGVMAFPVILICSYELCRSLRVRQPVPVGSFHPLPTVNRSLVFRDVGIIHEMKREDSLLSPSKGVAWNAVCL